MIPFGHTAFHLTTFARNSGLLRIVDHFVFNKSQRILS